MKPRETAQLSVVVNPVDLNKAVVMWGSSDPKVATVEPNGKVTAVSIGSAVITASVGEIKDMCDVRVVSEPKVNDFYYSDGTWSATLDKGKKCIGVVFAVNFDRGSIRNPNLEVGKQFPPYVNDPKNPDLKNLVVALEDLGDITVWDISDLNSMIRTTSTNWFNGSANMSAILTNTNNLDKLPPFKMVLETVMPGIDWYLPSANELLKLICVFNGQTLEIGKTRSFNFGENYTDEQMFTAFKQQRDAFNARLVEAGGENAKIYDEMYIIPNEPKYTGDLNDVAATNKWYEEVYNPWFEENESLFEEKEEMSRRLSYWSSTSLDQYAEDKDYYVSAISLNCVDPNFKIFPYKNNKSKVRAILAF